MAKPTIMLTTPHDSTRCQTVERDRRQWWHQMQEEWMKSATSENSSFISKTVHTHTFNGPLSGTTWVSWYLKGKTNLDFTEARHSEWQWNLLGHMQVCTSFQTDNHASTPPLSFYRPESLPTAQPTSSKH